MSHTIEDFINILSRIDERLDALESALMPKPGKLYVDPNILFTKDLPAITGYAEQTHTQWRMYGHNYGPPWYKENNRVFYKRDEVIAWVKENSNDDSKFRRLHPGKSEETANSKEAA